jgi:hypothetical protein
MARPFHAQRLLRRDNRLLLRCGVAGSVLARLKLSSRGHHRPHGELAKEPLVLAASPVPDRWCRGRWEQGQGEQAES